MPTQKSYYGEYFWINCQGILIPFTLKDFSLSCFILLILHMLKVKLSLHWSHWFSGLCRRIQTSPNLHLLHSPFSFITLGSIGQLTPLSFLLIHGVLMAWCNYYYNSIILHFLSPTCHIQLRAEFLTYFVLHHPHSPLCQHLCTFDQFHTTLRTKIKT